MLSIGIDFGGTNIACGLVDNTGKLLFKKNCKTGAHRTADAIMQDMSDLVLSTISEFGCEKDKIDFCGIAIPGIANPINGIVEYSCNLPSFYNFPILEDLKLRTGLQKIGIENDANCAAKGEAIAGAAKGTSNSVFITLGTGVGGGVIMNGQILNGINFSGAELGHMVIEKNGIDCSCGRKGCWEAYCSATALIRMAKEEMNKDSASRMWTICSGDISRVDGKTIFDAMNLCDQSAKKVFDLYVSYLSTGITNLINIFQPEILSVGGGISAQGETLLGPVRKIVEKEQYSRNCNKKTVLKTAELGNDAGIIGSALLWRTL